MLARGGAIFRSAFSLLLLSCCASSSLAGSTHLEARFDSAADLTGVGPLATGGPWDLAAVEVGSAFFTRHGLQVSGYVDASAGLAGSGQGLRLHDPTFDTHSILAHFDVVPDVATLSEPYWVEFTFRLDPCPGLTSLQCESYFADALVFWRGLLPDGTNLFGAEIGRTTDGRLRYKLNTGTTEVTFVDLGVLSESDEWRVRVVCDPVAGTHTHFVWQNGERFSGGAALGVPHAFRNAQTAPLGRIEFQTHWDDMDIPELGPTFVVLDELRSTTIPPPGDLVAAPFGSGQVRLSWVDTTDDEDGFVVERYGPGGSWQAIASGVAAGSTSYVDTVGSVKERFLYRVASVRSGDRSPWSDTAHAVPTYAGLPLFGWVVVEPTDDVATIQQKINSLPASGIGAQVVFFRNGIYDVDTTLYLEGRAGVQLIGESIGGVVMRWTGPSGSSPEDTQAIFHSEGNREATFRNFVWDAQCVDPANCFVVAFDHSYCGKTGDGERPSDPVLDECGADDLSWPEDPLVGFADSGSGHFDSVFRNAYIGLRIGHYQVQDSEMSIRRCDFSDNFVGASIEDQNALNEFFWDSRFASNWVGLTNDIQATRRGFDPSYMPGTCQNDPAISCLYFFDCVPEAACELQTRWGGDFDVFRGRFSGNESADMEYRPGGEMTLRDSWSTGSGRFVHALGITGAGPAVSLIGNEVGDFDPQGTYQGRAVDNRNPGPLLLVDNRFYSRADQLTDQPPIYQISFVGSQLLAVDNSFTVSVVDLEDADGPYEFGTPGHTLRSFGDQTVPYVSVSPPPLPGVVDPLLGRSVYTVTDASSAQAVIDAALADGGPAAVHFPGGRYELEETLTIPGGSDLLVTGDGPFTQLVRVSATPGLILDVDASGLGAGERLILRDLQLFGGGLRVEQLDDGGRGALLHRLHIAEPELVGVLITESDGVPIDFVDYRVGGNLDATGMLIDVGKEMLAPPDKPGIAVWSGSLGNTEWDFDVVNDVAGARALFTSTYMENSAHYLRARGAGGDGEVTVHGAKLASIALLDDPTDPQELADAVATVRVDDFPGNVSVVADRMFIQTGNSTPEASDEQSRITQTGTTPVSIQSLSNSTQATADTGDTDPHHALTGAADYLRMGVKVEVPGGTAPQPEIRVQDGSTEQVLTAPEIAAAEADVRAGLNLLRTMTPPVLYDRLGAPDDYKLVVDQLFVWQAPGASLILSGGDSCSVDVDCDDGLACTASACDVTDLPAGVPGACRQPALGCPGGYFCREASGGCVEACADSSTCDDGVVCTTDQCLFDPFIGEDPPPGFCRHNVISSAEVPGLLFTSRTGLVWSPPPFSGGNATLYDLLRSGDAGDFSSASCQETDVAVPSATDGASPPAGGVEHYLVRAQNECGGSEGTLGAGSDGQVRVGPLCP